jgi:hypothetical protein
VNSDGWGYWVLSLPQADAAGANLHLVIMSPAGAKGAGHIQESATSGPAKVAVHRREGSL